MDFNLGFWFITVLVVITEMEVSREERSQQTKFPIRKHGGIWGDLLLFSVINAIVCNHLRLPALWVFAVIIGISLVATVVMHQTWFTSQSMTSWVWPNWPESGCWRGMSIAGRLHVYFMAAQITILLLFILSPAPASVIWATAILLTVFWPLGVIQPCWYITGKWLDPMAVLNSVIMVSGTWGVCLAKLTRPEWIEYLDQMAR